MVLDALEKQLSIDGVAHQIVDQALA